MKRSAAEILREYGPFPGVDHVHGVTYDGRRVWLAAGDQLSAFDPASGEMLRSIDVAAGAGTAFDGQHLFQLAEDRIQKIDPETGHVLATIPAPGGGAASGLAWAEGTLWVGQYRDRKIHQVDPETGAILRTIESDRFVTGVTWVDGELWHGTFEGDESDLRRVDPRTGEVLERLDMPPGTTVSGLESDGGDQFYCGGGSSGKVRGVRRPRRGAPAGSVNDDVSASRHDPRPTIARIWRGRTRPERADEYEAYNYEVGIKPLIEKALGVQSFREDREDETEFVTISYWESIEAMSRFTGDDPTRIHHLERDAEFLIELPEHVQIFQIRATHGNTGHGTS